MASNYVEFYLQLHDGRLDRPLDDDTGVFNVLTAGSPVEATIFSDDLGTSGTNPGTMTNGVIQFWIDSATTTVDISVMTADGYAFFLKAVSISNHRQVIWKEDRTQRLVVPFAFSNATEVDTGFDFPANCIIKDVYLRVVTVDSGEDLDVGILASESNGDADGFLDAAIVSVAGVVDGKGAANGGTNIDYVDTIYAGAFLSPGLIQGTDVVAVSGAAVHKLYRTDGTAKSLSYTGSSGSDTAAGYIFVEYEAPV